MGLKRVLIAGSRSFNDYRKAKKIIDFYIVNIRKGNEIIIVSGGASGADLLGERYATENGFKIERHPADWELYGKSAGIRRNKEMVLLSDYVICLWDGVSKGTKSTIDFAKQYKKPVRVKTV